MLCIVSALSARSPTPLSTLAACVMKCIGSSVIRACISIIYLSDVTAYISTICSRPDPTARPMGPIAANFSGSSSFPSASSAIEPAGITGGAGIVGTTTPTFGSDYVHYNPACFPLVAPVLSILAP